MSFATDRRLARLVMPLGVMLLLGIAIGWGLAARGPTARGLAVRGLAADVDIATHSGNGLPGDGSSPTLQSAWPDEGGLASRLRGGPRPVDQSTDSARGSASRVTPVVEAVRRVLPSVVSVSVYRHERARARSLLDLFGPARDRIVAGLGSGFAIDDQGTILTNDHVVTDADSILIVDVSGRTYTATVVGRDELTDLAVVHVEPGRIPPAPLGRSSDLMVGEPAIAIGVPYGSLLLNSEATVTTGVISGVDRDIRSTGRRQVLYADMVQTDASINPGNSGGPLVNIRGEVIGVNSSIFSSSGGSQGLGFAIPIDRALRVAAELRGFGRIRRPWVGVDLATMPSDSFFSVATVRRVAPNSPAARAGLLEGDVILSLDGRAIRGALDWEIGLLDAGVNEDVQIRFVRGTQQHSASLRIEELPSERAERIQVLRGLELVTVTEGIAVERDLSVGGGALIVRIDAALTRRTGMRVDDVIVAINRREVRSAEEARDLLLEAARRGWVELLISRQGATLVTSFPIRR